MDIVVVPDGFRDKLTGSVRSAKAVDNDFNLRALVLGEFAVNCRAVEVVVFDVAFERNVICMA